MEYIVVVDVKTANQTLRSYLKRKSSTAGTGARAWRIEAGKCGFSGDVLCEDAQDKTKGSHRADSECRPNEN
ncbi:MAG TPA: hypothetical protein VKB58_04910 [Terriglobales bacterium]|nr:hypothetical protein [Terriglobales bacterium]